MYNKIFIYPIFLCLIWNAIQTATEDFTDGNKIDINKAVEDLIENFRKDMKNNNGLFENITLEPFSMKHQPFDINHSIGEFHGSIDNVLVNHLTDFVVSDIKTQIFSYKFNATFTFPTLTIKDGDYKVDGFIGSPPLFKFFGDGKFDLNLIDLQVKIAVNAGVKNYPHIYIKSIGLDVSLAEMKGYFHNLFGGGELEVEFNKVINELGPYALEHLWPELKPIVEKKAVEMGNEVVKDIDISTILKPKSPK